MATLMSNNRRKKADPMRTDSGKPRLGPLNVLQLTELLRVSRPKNRAKIQRRIETLITKYGHKPLEVKVDAQKTV